VVKKKTQQAAKPLKSIKPAHKQVTLHHHHAKPYRKRHVGFLVVMVAFFVLLSILLVQYRDQVITGLSSSRSFISDMFTGDKDYKTNVSSSYGFNLTYDQKQFYGSAVDGSSGDLFIGTELATQRAYNIVRVAPNFISTQATATKNTALTLTFHPGPLGKTDTLDAIALQDGGLDQANLDKGSVSTVLLDEESFTKTYWKSKTNDTLPANLAARFVTYSGLVQGNPITIVITLGVGTSGELQYDTVLDSLRFNAFVGYSTQVKAQVARKVTASRSVLDIITNTSLAGAASVTADADSSEKVSALYSPAVAKIYNAYCMDITLDGKPYLKDICSAASGSGFFVSQDGYIGTNGHVAATTPLDLAISSAINLYATKGDSRSFLALLNMTSLKTSDVPTGATSAEKLGLFIDAMYGIDAARFGATNSVQNLLVGITRQNPDIAELLKATNARETYTDKNVVPAELVAYDYRANDGYDGFKSSDVAVVKVAGSNYPIVTLGSIDTVTQGSDLLILGYPGNANTNGIVEASSSEATLTTGKVSAIKNASGSDKKLIETATTIGHGNSGGPAFDDDGTVVGIATYSADSAGAGDGTYNYIRDIKDFEDLARDSNLTFDTTSKTQVEWQKGIDNFYSSHYSKAVKNFQAVLQLYPNHSRAADLITAAEKRIAEGKDIKDFPVMPIIVASFLLLIGSLITVILIARHHRKHMIYKAGIEQGAVQPAKRGDPSQIVGVALDIPSIRSVSADGVVSKDSETVPGTNIALVAPEPSDTPVEPQPTAQDQWFVPDDEPKK